MKLTIKPHVLFQLSEGSSGSNQPRRDFLKMSAKIGLTLSTVGLPLSVLAITAATRKAVEDFNKKNPEWANEEFMPFEQDCIDGKNTDPGCDKAVMEQLKDRQSEIDLRIREAQVKSEAAQVKSEAEMINRTTIVTLVFQLNNIIGGKSHVFDRMVLNRIDNPIFQRDIAFLREIDTKLIRKETVTPQEITSLQLILRNQAQGAMTIYNSFTPEQQKEFVNTKIIAVGAQEYFSK